MLEQAINWLNNMQDAPGHRLFLVIEGSEAFAIEQTQRLLNKFTPASALSLNCHLDGVTSGSTKQFRHHLGQEFEWVIFNAHQGFRASAFSAMTACVKRSGLFILLCPPIADWPSSPDPALKERVSVGFQHSVNDSPYLRLFCQIIQQSPYASRLSASEFKAGHIDALQQITHDEFQLTTEQRDIIHLVCRRAEQHVMPPCVLRADRGRGKSTALGIIAHSLAERGLDVTVTAPSRRQLNTFFGHCTHPSVRFIPVDELLRGPTNTHCLLIDEAAMFPADAIKRLLQSFPKVVMATTVNGYEGSGRGFDIRVTGHLNKHYPDWQLMTLQQPVRWAENCPLESLTNQVMLMDTETSCVSRQDGIVLLSGQELAVEPQLLKTVWTLLINAHYQTTPDDLQRMLDGPENHLILRINNGCVQGALWLVEEPDHLTQLAESICSGDRRPSGYLLPQLLAYNHAQPEYLQYRYARVIRIATDETCRRRGVASSLLAFAGNWAKAQKFDLIGTTFGANHSLVEFWRANRYQALHLGESTDASSGEVSIAMAMPLNTEGQQALDKLTESFANKIKCGLFYREINKHTLAMILQSLPDRQRTLPALSYLCRGSRPALSQKSELLQLLVDRASAMDRTSVCILIDLLLMHRPATMVAKDFGLDGQKTLNHKLKQLVSELYIEN